MSSILGDHTIKHTFSLFKWGPMDSRQKKALKRLRTWKGATVPPSLLSCAQDPLIFTWCTPPFPPRTVGLGWDGPICPSPWLWEDGQNLPQSRKARKSKISLGLFTSKEIQDLLSFSLRILENINTTQFDLAFHKSLPHGLSSFSHIATRWHSKDRKAQSPFPRKVVFINPVSNSSGKTPG